MGLYLGSVAAAVGFFQVDSRLDAIRHALQDAGDSIVPPGVAMVDDVTGTCAERLFNRNYSWDRFLVEQANATVFDLFRGFPESIRK